MFWIAALNTKYPDGYNLTSGGSGFNGRKHTPESIALMSDIAKATWARRSPEERAEIARKREANRSPEERSAIVRRAWITRRANEAKKTPEERAASKKSFEELSAIAKKAAAKVDKTARNAKVIATWKSKTPEEISIIFAKRLATIQAKKKQQLIGRLVELLKKFLRGRLNERNSRSRRGRLCAVP